MVPGSLLQALWTKQGAGVMGIGVCRGFPCDPDMQQMPCVECCLCSWTRPQRLLGVSWVLKSNTEKLPLWLSIFYSWVYITEKVKCMVSTVWLNYCGHLKLCICRNCSSHFSSMRMRGVLEGSVGVLTHTTHPETKPGFSVWSELIAYWIVRTAMVNTGTTNHLKLRKHNFFTWKDVKWKHLFWANIPLYFFVECTQISLASCWSEYLQGYIWG